MSLRFPTLLRTPRLLIRPWTVADAPRLKGAIDENLAHLQAWMPWAMDEPSPLEVIEERIRRFTADFEAGTDAVYALFSADGEQVIGGSGLHPRIEDGVEIGYWVHRDQERRGYATEAAGALTEAAFALPGVREVQIRCDPRNTRSAAVPRRLGFHHLVTLPAETVTPTGAPRDTMVWRRARPT